MSDVYLIKGETLTAEADKIRERAPINWGGEDSISPIFFPDAIEDVWQEGYDIGRSDANNEITDLAGTTWRLNDSLSIPDSFSYVINFIASGTSYTQLGRGTSSYLPTLKYNDMSVYARAQDKWRYESDKVVTFTDGTAVTNADLIAWLHANGELISDTGYYKNTYLTSIDNYIFYDCNLLVAINFPNVTSIGENAFAYCSSLVNILMTSSVKTINQNAFNRCTSLIGITIPNSVTTIGNSAFYGCTSLVNATIGNYVTSIGINAFRDCTSLANITFTGTMAQWNAISKNTGWNTNVPATYVQCTDGQVAL